jgi:hypothetical protein
MIKKTGKLINAMLIYTTAYCALCLGITLMYSMIGALPYRDFTLWDFVHYYEGVMCLLFGLTMLYADYMSHLDKEDTNLL